MKKWIFVLWFSIAIFSFFLAQNNYLLFHSIIEISAIVVASMVVLIAFISYKENNFLIRLGVLYSFILVTDFLHTMAYKGMSVFHGWTANQPTQLWILGRGIEVFGMALALIYLNKKSFNWIYSGIFSFAIILGIFSIFTGAFPDCFIEGQGLTSFKVGMEYIFIGLIALVLFIINRIDSKDFLPYKKYYFLALTLTAFSELSFTLYSDVYGISNMLGHVLRLASYAVILQGFVIRSLVKPMNTMYNNLNKTLNEMEKILIKTIDIKDPFTAGHEKRVAVLAGKIADEMNLSASRKKDIKHASSLHAIGKIFIPSDILLKPKRLTDEEYGLVKEYVKHSYDLVKDIPFEGPVQRIILQQHERLDGSGYPEGLNGDKIMLEARILGVACVVEAMLFDRPHRRAFKKADVFKEIREKSGTLYDKKVVEACIKVFEEGFSFNANE
ncbi:MAG: HD domain-containing protein [Kosmotoga sp.]|nr:MAG: HD domain-containing protein [Kosmotoga sp.]